MLLNVLREQQPEYVAVAFDVGRTFRHDMYDAYKGHRERTPDELHTQVERIKEVVTALNIPIFTREGFEADDVLATLAKQAEVQSVDTLIVTGDRDILQVVDDHIHVLTSGRFFSDTILYTPEAVQTKYGLRPAQLVDYKALLGDKSDNIPGVKGIGEKGAADLLQRYGTLDAVYADIDQVTPSRVQTALKAGRADANSAAGSGRLSRTCRSSWIWRRAARDNTTVRRLSPYSKNWPSVLSPKNYPQLKTWLLPLKVLQQANPGKKAAR